MSTTAILSTEKRDILALSRPWVYLAPLDGVTDWAFREVCYSLGAEVTVVPMISAAGFRRKPHRMVARIHARHDTIPAVVQLYGKEPEDFRRAAEVLTASLPIVGIDLNMGCPQPQVVSSNHGSALLKDPDLAVAIVAATRRGTHLPVSVKFRSGWDTIVAPDLARRFEAAGADYLVIHGRTREEMFRGTASLDVIRDVKRAVTIPVIGNGDVGSLESAQRMLDETGVDGVMVGRPALGAPWLFAELQAGLKGDTSFLAAASDRWAVIRRHIDLAFAAEGDHAALTTRKHLMAYSRGASNAGKLRRKVEHLHTRADVDAWLDELASAN